MGRGHAMIQAPSSKEPKRGTPDGNSVACDGCTISDSTWNTTTPLTTVGTLSASTPGSAGLDVATVEDSTLWGTHVDRILLNVKGPIWGGCSALLLGRSSTTMTGRFVLPRVTDADYSGQMQAMVWAPARPLSVPKGTWIAQLILFRAIVLTASETSRSSAGFGSTGQPAVY